MDPYKEYNRGIPSWDGSKITLRAIAEEKFKSIFEKKQKEKEEKKPEKK